MRTRVNDDNTKVFIGMWWGLVFCIKLLRVWPQHHFSVPRRLLRAGSAPPPSSGSAARARRRPARRARGGTRCRRESERSGGFLACAARAPAVEADRADAVAPGQIEQLVSMFLAIAAPKARRPSLRPKWERLHSSLAGAAAAPSFTRCCPAGAESATDGRSATQRCARTAQRCAATAFRRAGVDFELRGAGALRALASRSACSAPLRGYSASRCPNARSKVSTAQLESCTSARSNAQRAPPRHASIRATGYAASLRRTGVAPASTPDAEDAADASKAANAALKEAYDHLAAARKGAQVKDLARLLHAGQHLVAGVDEPPEMPPPPPSAERAWRKRSS